MFIFRYLTIPSQKLGFRDWGIGSSRSLAVGFIDIAWARFAQTESPTEAQGMLASKIMEVIFSAPRSLALSSLVQDVMIQGYQGVVGTLGNRFS